MTSKNSCLNSAKSVSVADHSWRTHNHEHCLQTVQQYVQAEQSCSRVSRMALTCSPMYSSVQKLHIGQWIYREGSKITVFLKTYRTTVEERSRSMVVPQLEL